MSDIVERLRNYIHGEHDDDVPARIAEAADEIERLRAGLLKIRDDGKNCAGYCRTQAGRTLAVTSQDKP